MYRTAAPNVIKDSAYTRQDASIEGLWVACVLTYFSVYVCILADDIRSKTQEMEHKYSI